MKTMFLALILTAIGNSAWASPEVLNFKGVITWNKFGTEHVEIKTTRVKEKSNYTKYQGTLVVRNPIHISSAAKVTLVLSKKSGGLVELAGSTGGIRYLKMKSGLFTESALQTTQLQLSIVDEEINTDCGFEHRCREIYVYDRGSMTIKAE